MKKLSLKRTREKAAAQLQAPSLPNVLTEKEHKRAVESTAVEPTAVEPTVVEPTAVESTASSTIPTRTIRASTRRLHRQEDSLPTNAVTHGQHAHGIDTADPCPPGGDDDLCPICGKTLAGQDLLTRQIHMNKCLDSSSSSSSSSSSAAAATGASSAGTSGTHIPLVEKVGECLERCPICTKKLTSFSLTTKLSHIDRCLAEQHQLDGVCERTEHAVSGGGGSSSTSSDENRIDKTVFFCRFCTKDLSFLKWKARISHLKMCIQNRCNDVPVDLEKEPEVLDTQAAQNIIITDAMYQRAMRAVEINENPRNQNSKADVLPEMNNVKRAESELTDAELLAFDLDNAASWRQQGPKVGSAALLMISPHDTPCP
jgi:hypothetical protein